LIIEIYKEQKIARLLEELREKNKVLELMHQVLKTAYIIKEIQEKLEMLRRKEKEESM